MHILLYLIAFLSAIIGIAIGYQQEALNYISSGLLAGILGKIVHLLDQMEEHLRAMRRAQAGDAADGNGGGTGARG